MAIADYLQTLTDLRDTLYNVLKNAGANVTPTDTLSELIPLVDGTSSTGGVIQKPLYSFGVLSDVHIRHTEEDNTDSHFINALTYYKNKNTDFLCVAGDVVWCGSGTEETIPTDQQWFTELNLYKQYCDTYYDKPIYTTTGNHDASLTGDNTGTLSVVVPSAIYGDGTKTARQVWEDIIGTPLNYVVEKGNDVFIFMGMNRWNYTDFLSTDDKNWLETQLEAYKKKRVFLFFHLPLVGAFLHSSGMENINNTDAGEFHVLAQKYKNVVFFSGHSHYGMENEENETVENPNTYQEAKSMTMIHIPACAYIRNYDYANNKGGTRNYEGSQGLLVDVYESRIVVKSIDFANNNDEIQSATYVITT